MAENPNADPTVALVDKGIRVWFVAMGVVLALAAAWFAFTTGEPSILIFAVLLLPYLFMFSWMVPDARRQGLPVAPWVFVVAFLHVVGFVIYLVVRELRRAPDQ